MEQAAKPEPKPEAPVEKPPEGLGTNNKGPGPGLAGLGTSGNGVLGGTGSGTGNGSVAAWYGARVKNRIADTLKRNQKTRAAKFRAEVKLWPDASGRVEKVQMAGSTGNAELDAALTQEVLSGLQLEPPPAGVKMPIRLTLNLTRPN
jgi:TonB family protein